MTSPLHILILEDNHLDLEIIELALNRAAIAYETTYVETGEDFQEALQRQVYDVILADFHLPQYDGLHALRLAQAMCPETPFIFVTGDRQEDTEVLCLRSGATDYVHKDNLKRLAFAVVRAVREAENRRERHQADTERLKAEAKRLQAETERLKAEAEQKKLLHAIEKSPVSIVITDVNGKIEYVNPWFCHLTGYSAEEAIGKNPKILQSGITPAQLYPQLWGTIKAGEVWQGEFCNRKKDGSLYWESASIAPIVNQDGVITNFVAVKENITERRRAEEIAQINQRRLNSEVLVSQQKIGSFEELLDVALKEAIALSGSQSGFVYGYDEAQQGFVLHRWSKKDRLEAVSGPASGPMVNSLNQMDLLQQAVRERKTVIVNDAERLKDIGYPEALPVLQHMLLMPILMKGRVVALVGVGNKASDYTDGDVEQLELFADAIVKIGERLQVEEELRAREELFRELAENVHEVFWVRDYQTGRIVYVNPAYEQVWGQPCQSLYENANRFMDSIAPEDIERVKKAVQAQYHGTNFDEQFRIVRPDGDIRWVASRTYPVLNEAGEVYRLVGVAEDITERKQVEDQLSASEARYRAVVEDQTELISRWKLDGIRTFVNEAYYRYFGLTPEQALGSSFLPLIDPRDLPAVLAKNFRLNQGLVKSEMDIHRCVFPDQSVRWLEWNSKALYDEAGQIVEFQSVGRDVTERKQAEEQIRVLNEELLSAYDATIEGWAKTLELRDQETEGHSRRVVDLTVQIAQLVGIPEAQMTHVRRGAILHDVGKLGIPDSILLKPGQLTEQEWQVMRQHPTNAYLLLSGIPFLRPALEIPYYHHERWDGSGYPRGLKGEEIPLAARIFSIVDVWDALLHDRPYRQGWPAQKVLEYLAENAGKHFDPQVVQVFLSLLS